MSDNEIIKALECCKMPVGSGACNSCSLKTVRDSLRKEDTKSCTTILLENALDLINRQQVEIERLDKRIAGQKHALFEQQSYTAELQNELKTVKSEAIKEFAERLKGEICDSFGFVRHGKRDIDIDYLVKEMTGD